MDNAESVGLYTAASKITQMILGLVTSLVTVMLPRMSNLLKYNNNNEFVRLSQKSIRFTIALTLPMSVGFILISPYIVPLFSGPTYTPAILTLQIISPIIFFIGIGNLLGAQIL